MYSITVHVECTSTFLNDYAGIQYSQNTIIFDWSVGGQYFPI